MLVKGQWADTLLDVERLHVLKLLVWAALSVGVGTAMIALVRVRRFGSTLLTQFAIQSVAWGLIELVVATGMRRGLQLRDLAGAVSLDRFVWLNIGLDLSSIAVGVTLVVVGWRLERRLGLIGAGAGVVMQGCALTLFHLQLASAIVR